MSKEQLIKGLNEDLAAELGTIIRYNYQASQCVGPMGIELREMFEEEIRDELEHARFLSDAVTDLGGEPTTTPKSFDKSRDMKAMLEIDVTMEMDDVTHYMRHAELAEKLGLVELKMKLEEIAADEAGHARSLRRLLRGM